MPDYMTSLSLFIFPVIISHAVTDRKGLVTGLFAVLIFLCSGKPVLLTVPLAAASLLCVRRRQNLPAPSSVIYVKNPALPVLTVFLTTMAVFCALSDASVSFASYASLDARIIARGRVLAGMAVLAGPLVTGIRCDRKGPFSTAVLLALASEVSVLFISGSLTSPSFYLAGIVLMYLSVSGFFVVMPVIAGAFYGRDQFPLSYLTLLLPVVSVCFSARWLYRSRWTGLGNPGDFLIWLLFLSALSALFLTIAWKHRMVLVTDRRIR